MIEYKFTEGWDADITELPSALITELYSQFNPDNLPKTEKDISEPSNVYSLVKSSKTNISEFVHMAICTVINAYASEDCIHGLLSALTKACATVSPFIATHSYCLTVEKCDGAGNITMNISPIYHLGPDYAHNYKEKHGTALDDKAIIGPIVESTNSGHQKFYLGIDAGIVFKDSKISHNKTLSLQFSFAEEGLMTTLSCETQTTSKTIALNELGITAKSKTDKKKKTAN